MLHWIIASSLRLRVLVVALAAAVSVLGVWRLRDTVPDVVPEFPLLTLEVKTEALGLSAAEVESLITVPLEADLLNGVPWLRSIESESLTGLSSIEMSFAPGTNIMHARQMVQERLTQAHALPNVSSPPTLLQPVSSASRIMNIGLGSKTLSLIELSVQARWTIVPRLVGVPGVANVSIFGQRDRQLQVQVDPQRFHAKGVRLEQIVKTAGEAVWASPLTYLNSSTPGTGGFIDTPNQRLGVRHLSPTATPAEFAKIPVFGTALALGEVADVVEGHQPLIGDAILREGPGLMLVVEKFPGFNTAEVTRGVEAALRELSAGMTGIDVDTRIYRPASFIERATRNLTGGLLASALLTAAALAALAWNWRIALIGVAVLPLSLLAAALVLDLSGVGMNMMVIAGLLLAVGTLVDDAVMDVANIRRRSLQQGADGAAPSIVRSVLEVRRPMLYATLIMVIAVLPVLLTGGLSGAFFRPLALAYIAAVLASMLVALTVTPALAMLLPGHSSAVGRDGSAALRLLRRGYERIVGGLVRRPLPAMVLAVLAVPALALTWSQMERSLIPRFQETDLLVEWQASPGTSLQETNRITAAVMRDLRAIPGVRNAAAHVGRALLSREVADVNAAELWVSIDPAADYDDTREAIEAAVSAYPGLDGHVESYLSRRLREALTGGDESLTVRIYGHDLGIIRAKAAEIRDLLSTVDGIRNVRAEQQPEEPTIEVQVDLDRAARYGLKPGDVRRAASSLTSGITVGALFEEQKVFDVVVWGVPEIRNNLNDVQNLLIDTEAGGQVRLAEVADVRAVPTPSVIRRQGVSRHIDVDAEIGDRPMGAVADEVASRIRQVAFPFEYHAQVLGEAAARRASFNTVFGYAAAAALLSLLLLQVALGSWRLAMLSVLGAPVVLLGGLLAVALDDGLFSLGSLLGFITALGLTVRHGIMLVNHFQSLERREGVPFGYDLVLRGVRERFPAIATTLLTTAVLTLPFVVMGEVAGLELAHAIAVVVLGGVVASALVTLVLVPAAYLRFGAGSGADTLDLEAEPQSAPSSRTGGTEGTIA